MSRFLWFSVYIVMIPYACLLATGFSEPT